MGTRFAVLPMYDFEPLRAAHAAFWAAVATRAGMGDAVLRRGAFRFDDPDLVLAQTCGLPLTTVLAHHDLQLVATPLHDAPGCDGPTHRSLVVVRAASPLATLADARGGRCAINGRDSNTGMNLLRAALAPLAGGAPFFAGVEVTGAHRESMRAVAAGRADIAAIDCVTFALLARIEPEVAAGLRVVAETPASPALPMVAPAGLDGAPLRRALGEVAADPVLRPVLDALAIRGFATLPRAAYDVIGRLRDEAAALFYSELR